MKKIRFTFNNASGETLAGLLELPTEPKAFALFAHCFTCGKDIAAASRISRSLASSGIAVLRFDFTGLGNSDGDFANTNFSSNIDDLISAAEALEAQYEAPSLLVGHSLGGAAVLSAALKLDSVKAVATVAAPASANHVKHLFSSSEAEILEQGQAQVKLGLREFTLKRQFVEDLDTYFSTEQYRNLKAALLVMHSPTDTLVSINEAARIYEAARHPKSFISLDDADHLVSKPHDAEYIAATITAWVSRYLDLEPDTDAYNTPDVNAGEVLVTELDKQFLRGMYTQDHFVRADEPIKYGGKNLAPTPYDFLLMALGACTSMTLRMYANRKQLPLDDVFVTLRHENVHAEDCEDGNCRPIERLTRDIRVVGDLDDEQRQRLLEIADKCPVHRTLENNPEIVSRLVDN